MKSVLLMLFALIIAIPLQSHAEEIEIKIGESVSYDDLNLTVYDVEDSRCPLDITCVWEGKVSARIQTSNQTHKMGGPLEIGFPFTYIVPYEITLIDIKPYPVSTEKHDYVAILEITKLPESEEVELESVPNEKFPSGAIVDCIEGFHFNGTACVPDDVLEINYGYKWFLNIILIIAILIVVIVGIIVGVKVWRKRK